MAQSAGTENASGPDDGGWIGAIERRSAPLVGPRTPLEEHLVAIWREVLDRPDIGVEDDFFDLDGNSMHAIQVVSRIRDAYGVTLRATDFFESPTVAALAAFVAQNRSDGRPVVGPRPPDAEPVLSFDQHRLWLVDQIVPDAAYNVHGRHRLLGPLRVDVLERSIRAIRERHESLRTRFPDLDGEPLQVVDPADPDWRLPVVDVSAAPDALQAAKQVLDEEAAARFDLAEGPLFRCVLVRLGDGDHALGITAHHTVCDNGSVGLFVRELSTLYRQDGDVGRAGLPPLPIQYRDFAVWQRTWLSGETLERQLDYWERHLAGAPVELTLTGAEGSPQSSPRGGGRVRHALSTADTAAVHALCRVHDTTLFMALLASFSAVLGRWAGQRDVVLGVPITGRTDEGTRHLIGMFFNTLPVRMDLSNTSTFADLLLQAREVALAAYAHADVPLDLVVRRVAPPRAAGRTPLFQVVLNVVDDDWGDTSLGDVDEVPMRAPATPSKLDLVVTGREIDGSVRLELEYDADRYDGTRLEQLLAEVAAQLRTGAADPGAVVDLRPAASAPSAPHLERS